MTISLKTSLLVLYIWFSSSFSFGDRILPYILNTKGLFARLILYINSLSPFTNHKRGFHKTKTFLLWNAVVAPVCFTAIGHQNFRLFEEKIFKISGKLCWPIYVTIESPGFNTLLAKDANSE